MSVQSYDDSDVRSIDWTSASLVMDTVSAIYTESYRQRLDLNFKAAVQTVNAHLNQNHTFPEFSFLAFCSRPDRLNKSE